MKTVIIALLLTSPVRAQADPYAIQATLTEATDSKRPAFRCEGTTNLPDGSLLSIYFYYDKVREGRELNYQAIHVKEGKFSITLPIFRNRNLSGTYVLHVIFNPYLQQQKIQALLGLDLNRYEAHPSLTIGTADDRERDRKTVCGRLGAEIQRILDIAQEVDAGLKGKPDQATWEKQATDWMEQASATLSRAHNVPEYRAMDIADISEYLLENLSQYLRQLISAAGTHLANPELREPAEEVERQMKSVQRVALHGLRKLGLRAATPEELTQVLQEVRKITVEAGELYTWLKTDPKASKLIYNAKLGEFQKTFQGPIQALWNETPEKLHEDVRRVQEAAQAVFRTMEQARDAEHDPSPTIEKALDEFLRLSDRLETRFKE